MIHAKKAQTPHCLLLFLLVLMVSVSSNCTLGSSRYPESIIFIAAKNTAPIFESATSKAMSRAVWTVGNPIFDLFSMLKDYDPVASDGEGDLVSLYFVLYMAGQRCSECEERGNLLDETLIMSPYDFGRLNETYDRYLVTSNPTDASPPGTNYAATKKDGDVHYFLISWILHRTDLADQPNEHVVMQGSYNEADGTLDLDLANLVDAGLSTMSSRYHVDGNATTHHFGKFLAARWNWFSGQPGFGYRAWYVGTGYSRGVGQNFLFRIANNDPLLPPGKYFEFPADAGETTLQGMNDAGSDTTTLTDYQVIVDGLVGSGAYYDVITDNPTEVPVSASDFNGTGDGNMKPQGMP